MNSSNPLLAPLNTLIDYATIKTEHIKPAITELLKQAQAAMQKAQSVENPTWETLINPLTHDLMGLERAWGVIGHLNSVANTPELRAAYTEMLPAVTEFYTQLGLNQQLFEQYTKLKETHYSGLDAERQRILDESIRGFILSGVNLTGEKRQRYESLSEESAQLSQKFSENVLDSIDQWSYYTDDEAELTGIPDDVKSAAHESAKADGKTGWKLNLKMPCYLPVMQYAQSSALREKFYRAYSTVASEFGDSDKDNSPVISRLLTLRNEEAQLLDYKTYADMRLTTRMAQSTEQVLDFLRDLAKKAKPFAQQDLEALKAFAASKNIHNPQPWDYTYLSESLRQERYAYSDDEIKQYLSADKVLEGLFRVIKTLFNTDLKAITAPTWHPDVKVYEVIENNHVTGYLYMDLFARTGKQGGAWVGSERTRFINEQYNYKPVATLTCNFTPPSATNPGLLTHDDLITLFHESGHALHALLSKVKDPGAEPFHSVEWDAIELPSQFMENFCWDWSVIEPMAKHWETNETLPKALFDKLLKAKNYQSGMQTVRQLEFSIFDMLLHINTQEQSIDDVLSLLNEVRREVAVIIPPEWNRFPHNFSHLFAGGYSAGYYSYKWAEVLSADAYSLFEECAQETNSSSTLLNDIGLRFKTEILEAGGSRPSADSFKAFRGRDPDSQALLRHSGMLNA